MSLKFHKDARQNFSDKGRALLEGVEPGHSAPADPEYEFPISPYISGEITEKDIVGEIEHGRVDYSGKEIGRYFERGGERFAIEGEAYNELRQLAEQMQNTTTLRNRVSTQSVVDEIVGWLRLGKTDPPLPDYVLDRVAEKIADRTVVIPIHELYVESSFDFGPVRIRSITPTLIDDWLAQARAQVDDDEGFEVAEEKWRKQMQGKAAVEVRATAEPKRAVELARQKGERAVALLRLFHPAMFRLDFVSHCTLLGLESVDTAVEVLLKEGNYESKPERMLPPFPMQWRLSDQMLREFSDIGLGKLSELLALESPTPFQEKLIEALLLYSESALRRDLADRLLYMIVAIETMLLRDRSESIQQNIAERVAFLVAQDPAKRQSIVKDVKDAYQARSGFVHHGASVDDREAVERFMMHTWTFFNLAVVNSSNLSTLDELFGYIDRLKYS